MSLSRSEIVSAVEARDFSDSFRMYAIGVECPFCGEGSKITVREDGISSDNRSFCTNYDCRRRRFPILQNIVSVYYEQEVQGP